jgi:hypothetical protein
MRTKWTAGKQDGGNVGLEDCRTAGWQAISLVVEQAVRQAVSKQTGRPTIRLGSRLSG